MRVPLPSLVLPTWIGCAALLLACSDDETPSQDTADTATDAPADAGDTAPPDVEGSDDATEDVGDDTEVTEEVGPPMTDAEMATARLAELQAPGPFVVGIRVDQITYQPQLVEGEVTLRTAIWYPAAEETGRHPRYLGFPNTGAHLEAPMAPGPPRPVFVYSHGHLGYAEASSFLFHHLASHGWIVIAPDHTGNTTSSFNTPRTHAIYHRRSQDISAVLDYAAAIDRTDAVLNQALTDQVVLAGHSFGGYTAFSMAGAAFDVDGWVAACDGGDSRGLCTDATDAGWAFFRAGLRDERIAAIVPMASGDFDLFGAAGVAQIDVPVLYATGTRDGDSQATYWDAMTATSSMWVSLEDGGHQAFTDACAMAIGAGLGCQPDDLPATQAFAILNGYVLAFSNHVINQESVAGLIVDGLADVPEGATVQVR